METTLMKKLILTACILAAWAAPAAGEMSAGEIIAKARRVIGPEEKLRNVRALHYQGSMEHPEAQKGTEVEIYVKKNFRQRLEIRSPAQTLIRGLNDFEGWVREYETGNPEEGALQIMNLNGLKETRANAWENIHFYEPMPPRMGRVICKGATVKDGKKVHHLLYEYDDGTTYDRFFDVDTGKLVVGVMSGEVEIKEEGEIIVDGIRFPKKVKTYRDGKLQDSIVFSKITVNEDLPDKLFEVPSPPAP